MKYSQSRSGWSFEQPDVLFECDAIAGLHLKCRHFSLWFLGWMIVKRIAIENLKSRFDWSINGFQAGSWGWLKISKQALIEILQSESVWKMAWMNTQYISGTQDLCQVRIALFGSLNKRTHATFFCRNSSIFILLDEKQNSIRNNRRKSRPWRCAKYEPSERLPLF